MKLIRIIPFAIMSLCVLSCSKTADNDGRQEVQNEAEVEEASTRPYTREEIDEANSLYLPVEELRSFTEDMKAQRRASMILMEYLAPHDSVYVLEISEEDAAKLGVDPKYYQAALRDIERADSLRLQLEKRGEMEKRPLVDLREEFRAMKDSIFNKYPD